MQVVDAAEGMCIQTQAVLKTAYAEGLAVTLVINKIDRLVTELRVRRQDAGLPASLSVYHSLLLLSLLL